MTTDPTLQQNHLAGLETLLTIHEVAALLRVPEGTLRYWRDCNTGPASLKIGRHVRFSLAEIQEWLTRQRSRTGAA